MPVIILALISALASAAVTLTGRVLIALGVTYVSYKGINVLLDQVVNGAMSEFGGFPGQLSAYVGYLRIPQAISIITGAVTAKWTIAGLQNGTITKMLIK